ncbi:E3 SUMO-protein ligase ZBED1-like [Chaetodon trifascialis]|uniref:E3 SUMO-protein ligase ZBED1-like n=1 Tax=Chaetodon trifascialis TaxID=109706 RepID=UPI0039958969
MIAPLKAKLENHFQSSDDDTPLIAEMKRAFTNDFGRRYADVSDLLYTASALDPRFKAVPFLSDHDAERVFTSLSIGATLIHNEEEASHADIQGQPDQGDRQTDLLTGPGQGNQEHICSQIQDAETDDDQPPCKMKRKGAALDLLFGETFEVKGASKPSCAKMASEEVVRYRERDPLPLKDNPLQWWKRQFDLPLLSSLARRYLCIPATSVAAERVFSTAGDIVSVQRSVLRHDHVDQLIFLKKNLDLYE